MIIHPVIIVKISYHYYYCLLTNIQIIFFFEIVLFSLGLCLHLHHDNLVFFYPINDYNCNRWLIHIHKKTTFANGKRLCRISYRLSKYKTIVTKTILLYIDNIVTVKSV